MEKMIQNHWGKIALIFILISIIAFNFRPGYFILGNDNYSPELNIGLSLKRSFTNPTWREYRVLGMPSDSEQADIFRSLVFYFLNFLFPPWFISQLYVFFAFFIASYGMAYLARDLFNGNFPAFKRELIFLFSGLFYCANLITSWIFFSPLKVFLAGYAFLPFVLWRLHSFYQKPNYSNSIWLAVATGFLTTSAMVVTTYIVEATIIFLFLVFLIIREIKNSSLFKIFYTTLLSLIVLFGTQLFWILPFVQYVKTNSPVLQQSFINRVLTPELIENEVKFNKSLNVTRFYYAWIDARNNNGSFQFPYRNWYFESLLGQTLSFIPTALATLGTIYLVLHKKRNLAIFPISILTGWLLIKGVNPPFAGIFKYLQTTIPFFKQVFRWQSSKLYPMITIPLSVLAPLGVLFIMDGINSLLKNSHHRIKSVITLILSIIIISSSLIYVYPYFEGSLISKQNFVKVPQDYNNLLSFLKKYDTKSRIYLAPEANTLYFRNYSWGFFGSSLLNYLIPNPTIEKALTTGSMENENAQKIIENAYYSENAELFSRALSLYNTPLVLLDKYATKLQNGYFYNWDIAEKVIEKNPFLEKIWESGNLSLYRIIQYDRVLQASEAVYSNHDWRQFNAIQIKNAKPQSFFASSKNNGTIYPLALNFSEINSDHRFIHAVSKFEGTSDTYSYSLGEEDILNNPSQIDYDKSLNTVSISPIFPIVKVNNVSYQPELPQEVFQLDENARFLSIGSNVVDLSYPNNNLYISEDYFQTVKQSLLQWENTFTDRYISKTSQEKYILPIEKDSIVRISLKISSGADITPLNICVFSKYQFKCLNRENTIYLKPETQNVEMLLPEVAGSTDTLEIYLSSPNKSSQPNIILDELKATLWDVSSKVEKPISETKLYTPSVTIPLQKGDTLAVSIPKVRGYNSYHFDKNNPFVPDVTHGECIRDLKSAYLKKNTTDPLTFVTQECFDQSLIHLERIYPAGMALLYYQGDNKGGIPLIISMRKEKAENKIFEDRLYYESKTNKLAFFFLPVEMRSYLIELYSYGAGPRPSINTIENLSFQPIPENWYQLKLVPAKSSSLPIIAEDDAQQNLPATPKLYAINQAVHPNWRINYSNDEQKEDIVPARINGWEQGWIVKEGGKLKVTFWPNKLAFTGYIIDALIIAGLLLWPIGRMANKILLPKSSSKKLS